jgi:16S rRNA (cytosine1402-N4)-methyltransferase
MQHREAKPTLHLIAPGGIEPGEPEIKANPRARSARLRVAERTDAPLEDAA